MPDAERPRDGAGSGRGRPIDLDTRSIVQLFAAFVVLVAITGAVRSLPRTLASLAIAILLALALDPLVSAVERRTRLPRAGAVAAVLMAVFTVFAVAAGLLVPPAVRQARGLSDEVPAVIADLGNLPVFGDDLVRAKVPAQVERWLEQLPDRLRGDTTPIERTARSLADGIVAVGMTLLLAITLLLDGRSLLANALRLVPPHRRQLAVRLGRLGAEVVGRYVAGSMFVALCAGVVVLIAGVALGVPLTPLAAVWVALWDLVPQIGGAAGGIPFVLLGFSQGTTTGLLCAAVFIVYLQFENHVLSPLVVGQAVKLSPPATMAAALVGVSAGGVVGALLAVPLTGAVKAAYLELRPAPADAASPPPAAAASPRA